MFALLAAPFPGWAADAEPVRLVTPVVYGTHLPGLGEPASRLAKLIEERSGGALLLDLKQPGDGTKPHEILDKVSERRRRRRLRFRRLLVGETPRCGAVLGLPLRP